MNNSLVSKHVGYRSKRQLLDLFPVAIVSLVAAAVSFGLGYVLHLSLYLDGLLKVLVFFGIYIGWSFIFKPEAYRYFLTVLPLLTSRLFRKKHANAIR